MHFCDKFLSVVSLLFIITKTTNRIYRKYKTIKNSSFLKRFNFGFTQYQSQKIISILNQFLINILELDTYQRMVKNFDQQLLTQLKNRDFEIKNLPDEKNDNNFMRRIHSIIKAGTDRNRIFFQYQDAKNKYDRAVQAVSKQISLAVNDGLLNEIGTLAKFILLITFIYLWILIERLFR